MRDGGRIAAAIEVLIDFETRRVPLKVSLADWARGARYAGAKDRAFISGLALDVLRRKGRLLAVGEDLPGAVALALKTMWNWDDDRITAGFAEVPHGPGALTEGQIAALRTTEFTDDQMWADIPEFVRPLLERVSENPLAEITASATRAPVDFRVNTLKSDTERVLKALSGEGAEPGRHSYTALRIPAAPAERRGPSIDIHPAYQKGWVEVQDEGSQLAALAAGQIDGAQVLDYCAGGGGKTLAIAAMMGNQGQIHAYDVDARRLAPIFERARRAGVRNLQVVSLVEGVEKLEALRDRMDLVFVDAPCSGAGTWRRRPDTKWRLTENQLAARTKEQDQVLAEAAQFVRPGGAMVYVTCSPFAEENEDRVLRFLERHDGFEIESAQAAMEASGLLKTDLDIPGASHNATLRLTPATTGTDGFAITRLRRLKE